MAAIVQGNDDKTSFASRCFPCLICDVDSSGDAECAFCAEPLSSAPA